VQAGDGRPFRHRAQSPPTRAVIHGSITLSF
jgi:hypothetical protein